MNMQQGQPMVAEEVVAEEPVLLPISQQLRSAVAGLTSAATNLDAAKGSKLDADTERAAAEARAATASTDLATARTVFTEGCDELVRVVTVFRDSA